MTAKKADTTTIELEGTLVPLDVQINGRARNISLRVDERTGGIELVLPRFVAKAEGLAFVHEKSRWIMHQVRDRPPNVPFAHGAVIPLLGIDHEIVHQEGAHGTVWVDRAGATLNVAGQAPQFRPGRPVAQPDGQGKLHECFYPYFRPARVAAPRRSSDRYLDRHRKK